MKTKLTPEQRLFFEKKFMGIAPQLSQSVSLLDEVELFWNDRYNVKNGILGSFWFIHPNEICLSPVGKDMPGLLVGVLFHELHHRWQFVRHGLLYLVETIPGIRRMTIEVTAYEVERQVDALMDSENA